MSKPYSKCAWPGQGSDTALGGLWLLASEPYDYTLAGDNSQHSTMCRLKSRITSQSKNLIFI